MDMLCLFAPGTYIGRDVVSSLSARTNIDHVEVADSPQSLAELLPAYASGDCLLFFAAHSPRMLQQMLELRKGSKGHPLVLLVNNHPPEMFSLAKRLQPQLLAPLDTNGEDLSEVVANMLTRMATTKRTAPRLKQNAARAY